MLKNEYFVFTGTLTTMTRKQAQFIIEGLQGNFQNSVTRKTTRIVMGDFPIDLLKGYSPSKKIVDGRKAIESGQKLIIMSEKEFLGFLTQFFNFLTKGL
ncbi:BRCT domain-containing protein [Lactococcus lactis]|uniref:BRCT domain-containing protein n=1 Tax=Lactococcus lactis TaxID=1358 RepID=UPI00191485A3|nr:BRCT domain-containing protein [Lactococcus lactis]MBK5077725.1 BRCT domain-containing protein [Lactococcus lactis]